MHVTQQLSSKQGLIPLLPSPLRQKQPRSRAVAQKERQGEPLAGPPLVPLLVTLEQVLPLELRQVPFAEGVSRKRRIRRRNNRLYNRDKHSNNRGSTHSAEHSHRALMLKGMQ